MTDDANPRRSGDLFFEMSTDLLCVVGIDGRLHRVNPAFRRTFGWTEEDLLERPFMSFVHPEDLAATGTVYNGIVSGATPNIYEFVNRWRCSDASYRWISWSTARSLHDDVGYAVGRDTTERRSAENEIRTQSALLRAAIGGTDSVVFVKDADGRYLFVMGTDIDGQGPDEIIGRTDADVAPAFAERRRESDLRVMASGETEVYEYEHATDGVRRVFTVTKAPYRAADGAIIGVVGVTRDISPQRRLEAQVQQATGHGSRFVDCVRDRQAVARRRVRGEHARRGQRLRRLPAGRR